MGPLRELLAVDERRTLEFFVTGLQDVCDGSVDRQELLYNASVLAHYAQLSTQAGVDFPAPANLSEVFDHFVSDTSLQSDSLMMETAGAQCLLLAGFFEDQMRRRHNIRWYAELGASFFRRAALHEQSLHKARLLDGSYVDGCRRQVLGRQAVNRIRIDLAPGNEDLDRDERGEEVPKRPVVSAAGESRVG
jgi:hypothetical protein